MLFSPEVVSKDVDNLQKEIYQLGKDIEVANQEVKALETEFDRLKMDPSNNF